MNSKNGPEKAPAANVAKPFEFIHKCLVSFYDLQNGIAHCVFREKNMKMFENILDHPE